MNGHVTRYSDSSLYDMCMLCGATDGPGDGRLEKPCPHGAPSRYPEAPEIYAELERAKRHGDKFLSAHEAYGVILEELEEFWDHVRLKRRDRSASEIREELVQLAAMSIKAIQSIENFVGGNV